MAASIEELNRFLIEVQVTYNLMVVSGVHHNDSTLYIMLYSPLLVITATRQCQCNTTGLVPMLYRTEFFNLLNTLLDSTGLEVIFFIFLTNFSPLEVLISQTNLSCTIHMKLR